MASPIIDLRRNYPVLESQQTLFAEYLVSSPELQSAAFSLALAEGTPEGRKIAASWLSTAEYPIDAEQVFIGIGGHHGCLVAILAAGLKGKAIAVEEYTYASFKQIAALMDITLVAVQMDAEGLIPASLVRACQGTELSALYFMPTVHNPAGTVMGHERRQEIVRIAREYELLLIEDDAYGFLDENEYPNFAMLAPERCFYIQSLSKPFAPGLKIAFFIVPIHLAENVKAAISATSSNSVPLFTDFCSSMIRDGGLLRTIREKRSEGARRQQIARALLNELSFQAHPNSWHLWAELPSGIDADELASRALQAGIDINASSNFFAPGTQGKQAIRIGLGGPKDEQEMVRGLEILKAVLDTYRKS